jgi:hypothetical protein
VATGRRRLPTASLIVTAILAGCVSFNVSTLQTFSSPEGRFSVTVPGGAMTESTFESGGVFAGAPAHAFATSTASGLRMAVLYADADPSYLAGTSVDAALAAAEQANVASTEGTQQSESSLTVTGQPGREQRIIAGAVAYIFRLVFVGNRLYSISVTGSPAQVDGADAHLFLDSFAVNP